MAQYSMGSTVKSTFRSRSSFFISAPTNHIVALGVVGVDGVSEDVELEDLQERINPTIRIVTIIFLFVFKYLLNLF
jgi:hypothetical protein